MQNSRHAPGVLTSRQEAEEYRDNFADLHPPLSDREALVAADRCYFCHDAPCVEACPTGIDIPLFIRQISTGASKAAAMTIFDSNILGGMCARVCPTETLCEEVCVRQTSEGNPVEIGRLQRHATDAQMATGTHPYRRAAPTGKSVAVIGAGPAGLACAHRLAMKGHDVSVFETRPKGGGLNEYGIAAYKTVNDFAAAELDWLLGIGGISLHGDTPPVDAGRLDELCAGHDAIFLAIGLAGVNSLGIGDDELENARDAVDFIAELRQSPDLSRIPVGRDVVVLGGGMTAIDAAVQSKLLGAETVTIAYRGDRSRMSASKYEQDLATSKGVRILTNMRPVRVIGEGQVEAIELMRTETDPDGLRDTGERLQLVADQLFRAIGQRLTFDAAGLKTEGGKICVSGPGRTSVQGVWAGGDCASGGDDLTVTAVAQGRDAADDIHACLSGN